MKPWILWLSILVVIFVSLLLAPATLLIEIPIVLVAGWIAFLFHVVPRVRVDPAGLATAALCLLLLVFGTQAFGNWFSRQVHTPPTESRWPLRRTLGGLGLVLLLFTSGIAAAGVAHQAGWLLTTREPLLGESGRQLARRAQSTANLKELGWAFVQYDEARGAPPPGGTFDTHGAGLHGWMTDLLPYVEQQKLYDTIRQDLPWNHPLNRDAFTRRVMVYLNPGIDVTTAPDDYALAHYAANMRVLNAGPSRPLNEYPDGTANTILSGEIRDELPPWGSPTNWRDPALGINTSPRGFGGPFQNGMNFAFADGSVRFVKNSINPAVLRALSTPDGNEDISELYKEDR